MKSLVSLVTATLLGFTSLIAFTGDIYIENSNGGQSAKSKIVTKGSKIKHELPDNRGALIIDGEKAEIIILMDDTRQYIVQKIGASDDLVIEGEVHIIEGEEEILGLPTRKFVLVEENGGKFIISATASIQNVAFAKMPGVTQGLTEQMKEVFGSTDVLTMRMENYNRSGDLMMKMEATELVEREVADSEFLPPAGYTELVLPKLPAQPE
ncbi:DUF4412 domain-containing protein [Cerasicoccus frondis]|uniref:DUF4412 domain-containing protein n=1 Tax=Cerasicoccus frondis TaxID=490090 RepID=UPI002852660B|nr:DUF4412 domain-containing protein [Cerasicoccus frondis]